MKSTLKITLLGGINEIGGNCVLLEDLGFDVNLLIDFGINFERFNHSFDYEAPSNIESLFKANLIPRPKGEVLKNLYSRNYIFNHEKQRHGQKVGECKNKTDPPTKIHGLLISHAHRDHYYCIPLLNRNIPIYTGVTTKKIIMSHYDTTGFRMDNFYTGLKWKLFRTGNTVDIKGLEILPIHVDHSVPGSYGFIFKTSAGIIVYSGDFRLHGPLSYMTGDLLLKVKELLKRGDPPKTEINNNSRVKCLICEGTHIHKGAIESESTVKKNLKTLFKNIFFDYVLVKYDRVDWDRFRTYATIAKHHNWKYIITEKDAYFYYRLNKRAIYPTMKNPHIRKDDHIYILKQYHSRYPWRDSIENMLKKHDKMWRYIDFDDIKNSEGNFFLYITSLNKQRLMESLPQHLKGLFLSSTIDPYTDHFYDDSKSLEKKLLNLRIPSYRINASGHAKPHDIYKYIMELNPENLIPIHTKYPELFEKLLSNNDINVIVPHEKENGFQIELS